MVGRPLTVHCHTPGPLTWEEAPEQGALPQAGGIDLWFSRMDELMPRYGEFCALLDPVEQERAERFRHETDRDRFIVGHGLLRSLLGRYLKSDGSLIRFARGPFGKPYLERKKLRFNFSDTKDAFLVGVAQGHEIGVDIETMARKVDHEAVSEHYFTMTEIAGIKDAGDRSKQRFLEFWTRKEAVLKASGVGIMEDLRVLRVDAPQNVMVIEHESFMRMATPEYHVHSWSVGEGHMVSLATPSSPAGIRFFQVPITPPPRNAGGS